MSARKNNSFLNRVSRTFLVLGIVPALLFLLVYSGYSAYNVQRAFKDEIRHETAQILRQMNGYFENLKFISDEILYRSNFYNSAADLKYRSSDNVGLQKNLNAIASSIRNYGSFQNTYNIIYLSVDGYYYNMNATPKGSTNIYRVAEERLDECEWIAKTRKEKSALVWTVMDENGLIPNITEQVFSLVRAIHVPTEVGGYLITQIRTSDISPAFGRIVEYGGCVCLQEDGVLLYAEGELPSDMDTENITEYRSGGYLRMDAPSEEYNMEIVVFVPYSVVTGKILYQLLPLFLISGLVILSVIFVTMQYAEGFSRPLISLTDKIKGVTLENLDMQKKLEMHGASDEVLYLDQVFSDMSLRLNSMIEDKITQQAMQAELKYQALQYQINPHFIYNTLDIIGIMGYEQNGKNVYEACQKLAGIMRYSLKDFSQGTTFRQEFDNADTYLSLMKFRYEHKIEFVLERDERLDRYRLPCFTVQPLAENVFAHGFDSGHPIVRLRLESVLREDGTWHIRAEDDGRPIPEEAITLINEEVGSLIRGGAVAERNDTNIHGIGLKNTLVRLYFFYGESFRYRIRRREDGSGCVIELSGMLKV